MATIPDVYEAFGKVNLREDLPGIVLLNADPMIELIEGQLQAGKLATNTSITPSYANKYYAKKKFGMNSLPGYGVPDLKVSGDYYAGIGVELKSEDEYDIESDVDYAQNPSITQYGDELLALSDENKQKYCDDTLAPAIANYIFEKTGIVLI